MFQPHTHTAQFLEAFFLWPCLLSPSSKYVPNQYILTGFHLWFSVLHLLALRRWSATLVDWLGLSSHSSFWRGWCYDLLVWWGYQSWFANVHVWAPGPKQEAVLLTCRHVCPVRHGRVSVQWYVAFILTIRSGDVSELQSDWLGRDTGHTVPENHFPQELALPCGHELGSSIDSQMNGIYLLLKCRTLNSCCLAWVSVAAPSDSSTMIISNIYKPPFIKSRLEGRVVGTIKQVSPMKP